MLTKETNFWLLLSESCLFYLNSWNLIAANAGEKDYNFLNFYIFYLFYFIPSSVRRSPGSGSNIGLKARSSKLVSFELWALSPIYKSSIFELWALSPIYKSSIFELRASSPIDKISIFEPHGAQISKSFLLNISNKTRYIFLKILLKNLKI